MPQPCCYMRNTRLFTMNGIFGRLQFAASDQRVLIDLCADLYDVDGFARQEHAVTSLSVTDAKYAYSLLGRAIAVAETADERQSWLWGDATHAVRVWPRREAQVHRLYSVREGASDPLTIPPMPLGAR